MEEEPVLALGRARWAAALRGELLGLGGGSDGVGEVRREREAGSSVGCEL